MYCGTVVSILAFLHFSSAPARFSVAFPRSGGYILPSHPVVFQLLISTLLALPWPSFSLGRLGYYIVLVITPDTKIRSSPFPL